MPEYPIIHPDRRVTFRIYAPTAEKVEVAGHGADSGMGDTPVSMERDSDGNWEVTAGPFPPGFHYYQILIDGFGTVDPNQRAFWGWGMPHSGLEIPGKEYSFSETRNVPHGEMRIRPYHSSLTGKLRQSIVYTPPGYENTPDTAYPVLYLQHGSGESELAWTQHGKINFIMDNLISEGKTVPMIVVNDNGYAHEKDADLTDRSARNQLFEPVLLQEIIPMIDRNYRTVQDRKARAIAGLSMGAGQALRIGMKNLDTFASIGAFSGGGRNNEGTGEPETLNEKLDLLWIGCGRNDGGFRRISEMHADMQANDIEHVWYECDGAHEWKVWRLCFLEFARQLFQYS